MMPTLALLTWESQKIKDSANKQLSGIPRDLGKTRISDRQKQQVGEIIKIKAYLIAEDTMYLNVRT